LDGPSGAGRFGDEGNIRESGLPDGGDDLADRPVGDIAVAADVHVWGRCLGCGLPKQVVQALGAVDPPFVPVTVFGRVMLTRAACFGSATGTVWMATGTVIRKMMSSTSMTSTRGVVLIVASRSPSSPWLPR
jgi:hypothetical protein